ncbi:MAG: hypothetical protein WCL16_06045 [bacterium]
MTVARRFTFWLSLGLITSAFVVWTMSVPYQPRRLFEAIPASATLVADINTPAASLMLLADDPFVRHLALPVGVPAAWFDTLAQDAGVRRRLNQLAARRAVLAYVPNLDGAKGSDAWVFASWIGGHSQRLRWQAGLGKLPGFNTVRFPDGGTVWVASHGSGGSGLRRLSLAISEGVLLGCWSSNMTGARILLETLDGRPGHPSVATSGRWSAASAAWPAGSLVRGWLDLECDGAPPIAWALTQAGATQISGEFARVLPQPPGMCDSTAQRASADALAPLLGNTLDAVALLPAALLRQLLPDDVSAVIESLGFPLGRSNILALAVLDNAHSGRLRGALGSALPSGIKGLKTLTALAGDWVGADDTLDHARLQTALSPWNKRWQAGLHIHPVNSSVPSEGVRVEDALPGFYHAFEPDEQVALVATNGWRIAATHAGALRACFGAAPAKFVPRWYTSCASHPDAVGWFWLNPAGLGENARDLLAIINMVSDGGDAAAVATRQHITRVSNSLSVLDDLPSAEGWLNLNGNVARLRWTVERQAKHQAKH